MRRIWTVLLVLCVLACGPANLPRQGDGKMMQPPVIPRLWLFSAGVSSYDDKNLSLQFAEEDARAVNNLYGSVNGTGIPEERRIFIESKRADRATLLGELNRLMDRTAKDDQVIIFLSMHGLRFSGQGFYLLTRDSRLDNLMGTAIREQELHDVIFRAEAKRIVLLLDTCHSGAFGFTDIKGATTGVDAAAVREILNTEGVGVLSSSSAGEASKEDTTLGHGLFTYHLLDGLQGKADGAGGGDEDGIVTLREMYDFIYGRVGSGSHGKQHPDIKGADLLPLVARPTKPAPAAPQVVSSVPTSAPAASQVVSSVPTSAPAASQVVSSVPTRTPAPHEPMPTGGDIRGSVRDVETGAGVASAALQVTLADGRGTIIHTNGNGEFALNALPPGQVSIAVAAPGYNGLHATVNVLKNDAVHPTIIVSKGKADEERIKESCNHLFNQGSTTVMCLPYSRNSSQQLVVSATFASREANMRTTVRAELERARKERDVVKVLCLNDKLNQIDVAIRSALERNQALEAANARDDRDLANHEFAILTVLYVRSAQMVSEAQQCIGDEGVTVDTVRAAEPDNKVKPGARGCFCEVGTARDGARGSGSIAMLVGIILLRRLRRRPSQTKSLPTA